MIEVEIKLAISHESLLNLLEKKAIKVLNLGKLIIQDSYIDNENFDLKREGKVLRLRFEGRKISLQSKSAKISEYPKKRLEKSVSIPANSKNINRVLEICGFQIPNGVYDEKTLLDTLHRSGYRIVLTYRKERTTLRPIGYKAIIYLDKIDELGEYVEIEGPEAEKLVETLKLQKLQVKESYPEMIWAMRRNKIKK